MTAEIVSVGTEILMGQIADTNAAVLGELFAELGIRHVHRQTVGDNLGRLTEALRLALSRADVVVTIGGLGPTQDDLTRDGIAAALDDPLVLDPALETHLRELFAARNLRWVDSQTRQAMRPACGTPIDNPNGTASGLICRKGGKVVIAMPGPRGEFIPMARGPVRDLLAELGGRQVFVSRVVRVAGIGEAAAEQLLGDLIQSENPTVAPYAKPAEVHFRVTARSTEEPEARRMAEATAAQIVEKLGDAVYGFDHTTFEAAVVDRLRTRRETVAVAESCTGGMLGMRFTSVAGSSDVFLGGVISYANSVKSGLLQVPATILQTHGAVSAECAEAMAHGARQATGSDWALSITGIAGPGGGIETKPVGLVYIGLAGPKSTRTAEHRFRGQREDIRTRATQAALLMLYRAAELPSRNDS